MYCTVLYCSSPRRRAAERPRDHGHGTRPSPTQTAPGGGRSRDHLVGGGRGASHVLYPDLAGRASWPGGHRDDGGERGGAQQPFLSIEGSVPHSHFRRVMVARATVEPEPLTATHDPGGQSRLTFTPPRTCVLLPNISRRRARWARLGGF